MSTLTVSTNRNVLKNSDEMKVVIHICRRSLVIDTKVVSLYNKFSITELTEKLSHKIGCHILTVILLLTLHMKNRIQPTLCVKTT